METCLIWKGHITEIYEDGTFNAEIYNVIENTTKECATFSSSDIEGDLEIGKVFYWVVTEHGHSLQFMQNVSHEEMQDDLKKAIEKAKEYGRMTSK